MIFVMFPLYRNMICLLMIQIYETLCMNVNNELSKLNEWFSINKLSLNVKKTNFMVFGNKHTNEELKISKILKTL